MSFEAHLQPLGTTIDPAPARRMGVSVLVSALLLVAVERDASGYESCGSTCSQSDGSAADTQAAIDGATDGWTVRIPAGQFDWASQVVLSGKAIALTGAGAAATTLRSSYGGQWNDGMLSVLEAPTGHVVVENLTFVGGAGSSEGVLVGTGRSAGGLPIVIRNCRFEPPQDGGSISRAINEDSGRALVHDCAFTACGTQAVRFGGPSDSWTQPDSMGGADNAFVEDCEFIDIRNQTFDFDGNSRVVVRHSTFFDSSMTSHGLCTSEASLRHFEVYDNTFDFDETDPPDLSWWMYVRGGTGVVTDNVMDDLNSQMWGDKTEILLTVFPLQRSCGQYPGTCCTTYPCEQQVGQGHDGSSYVTAPIYVWNNTGTDEVGCTDYSPDECGHGLSCTDFVQEGRDYFRTAKPGYTKFSYPHPLRGVGGSGVGGGSVGGTGGGTSSQGGADAGAGGLPAAGAGEDDGGCGCRAAPRSRRGPWTGLLFGLVAALRRSSRRRERSDTAGRLA